MCQLPVASAVEDPYQPIISDGFSVAGPVFGGLSAELERRSRLAPLQSEKVPFWDRVIPYPLHLWSESLIRSTSTRGCYTC